LKVEKELFNDLVESLKQTQDISRGLTQPL
jgi:hypothetical protein